MADNLVLTKAVVIFRPVLIKTPRFTVRLVITWIYGDEESNDFLREINNVLPTFQNLFLPCDGSLIIKPVTNSEKINTVSMLTFTVLLAFCVEM